MTDWATMAAARTEMKRVVLDMYDDYLAGGYDREEALIMIQSLIVSQAPVPGIAALAGLWIERERAE